VVLDQTAFAFPITNLAELPAGDYFAQAYSTATRICARPNHPEISTATP
jgi:hypothetical protein